MLQWLQQPYETGSYLCFSSYSNLTRQVAMLLWLQQPVFATKVPANNSDAPQLAIVQHYSVVSDSTAGWYFQKAECRQ